MHVAVGCQEASGEPLHRGKLQAATDVVTASAFEVPGLFPAICSILGPGRLGARARRYPWGCRRGRQRSQGQHDLPVLVLRHV